MKSIKSPILISNWKSNPSTILEAKNLIKEIEKEFNILKKKDKKIKNLNFLLALPAPFIFPIKTFLKENKNLKNIVIGAQNFDEIYTGNVNNTISLSQIKSVGAEFVILNDNSQNILNTKKLKIKEEKDKREELDNIFLERLNSVSGKIKRGENINKNIKEEYKEDINTINIGDLEDKAKASLENEMGTILFIKENDFNNISGIADMVKKIVKNIHYNLFERLIICYEPKNINSLTNIEDSMEKSILIRRTIANMFGIDNAKKVKIVYSGKVDEDNIANIIKNGGVDGVMIGESSLEIKNFVKIISKINN